MSRVLITMPVAAAGLRRLEDAGHELDLVERPAPAEFRARLARADAVILRFQALSRQDIMATTSKIAPASLPMHLFLGRGFPCGCDLRF